MALPVPLVKETICGSSLRTGALIIGYLCLVQSIFSAINTIVYGEIVLKSRANFTAEIKASSVNEHSNNQNSTYDEEKLNTAMTYMIIFVIILALMSITKLIIDIFLVVGIYKKNHYYMLPWVILATIGICIGLAAVGVAVVVIVISIGMALFGSHQNILSMIVGLVIILLTAAIAGYCYIIVYSYYCEIKEIRRKNRTKLDTKF